MVTTGSLCFNTAAGCISRHQLVQFHNRMCPRAQQGLRCSVWQHKCHHFSLLAVEYFIGSRSAKTHRGRAHLLRTVSGCWTVHFSHQTPGWGKSPLPNRSHWEASLTQPWARLWKAYTKQTLQSVPSQDNDGEDQFTALSLIWNTAFQKKDQMVLGEHCSILVTFFFQISIVT